MTPAPTPPAGSVPPARSFSAAGPSPPRRLPPEASLRVLAEELPAGRARNAVRSAADAVANGAAPAAALAAASGDLPPEIAGLAGALSEVPGEALPAVLGAAAGGAADRAEDLRRARWVIVWPFALAGLTALVALAGLGLIAPGVGTVFEEFGTPVPPVTRGVVAIGETVAAGWFALVPLAAIGLAALTYFLLRPGAGGRAFAPVLRTGEQARAAELLAVAVENRLPLPAGLFAASAATADRRVAADLAELAGLVRTGVPASDAAGGLAGVPSAVRAALRWEGDPAALAEGLRGAAAALRAKSDLRLSPAGLLAAVIQPTLVLGLALLAAGGMVALVLPLIALLEVLT